MNETTEATETLGNERAALGEASGDPTIDLVPGSTPHAMDRTIPSDPTPCVWLTAPGPHPGVEIREAFLRQLRDRGVHAVPLEPRELLSEAPLGEPTAPAIDPTSRTLGRTVYVVSATPSDFSDSLRARERFPRWVEFYLRVGAAVVAAPRIPAIYWTVRNGWLVERVLPPEGDEVPGRPDVVLDADRWPVAAVALQIADTLERMRWVPPAREPPPEPRLGGESPRGRVFG